MATFAAVKGLSQAAILSAPATAPVSSKTLAEAQQRARYFYREVRWWAEGESFPGGVTTQAARRTPARR